MKKKIFGTTAIVLLSLLLIAGTALAGAIHGRFDGYPIIKLFMDGEELEADVPAVVLNGRTMVPLRVIGEELGINFDFNADDFEVRMDMPEREAEPEPEPEKEDSGAEVKSYLEDNYRDWEVGGRVVTFNISLDENYRGNDNVYVSFQIERDDYINWRDLRRLYMNELEDKIIEIINYLEDEYPNSGINLLVVRESYDSYEKLAGAVDLKEVYVNSNGEFVIEETMATGFSWPDATQPKIDIE